MASIDYFRKSKLNWCLVHGCKDRVLRPEFTENGSLLFVCRTHGFLLDVIMEKRKTALGGKVA